MKDQNKWVCNSCNTRNSSRHSFCIKCGAKRPKGMQCPKCGAGLVPNQKFCFNCGTLIQHDTIIDPPINISYIKEEHKHGKFLKTNGKQQNTDQPNSHCTKCGRSIDGDMDVCEQCLGKISKIWTRSIAAILVVALLSGIAVHFVGNRVQKVKNAEQAIFVLKDLGEELGYKNAFSELTEENTTTIDGDSYYRLQQNYKGIPVYGQTVVCATDKNKNVTSITGNMVDVNNISVIPKVTPKQIEDAIKTYAENKPELKGIEELRINELTKNQLSIYNLDGRSKLVYVIQQDFNQFVVDAHNCEILEYVQTIQSEYVSAEGYTASDLSNSFSVAKGSDNYYIMKNLESGHTVYTLEGKNSDVVGIGENVATLIKSADNIFGNDINERRLEHEKAALLLVNMDKVYEYFRAFDFYTKTGTINLYYNDAYCNGLNARAAVLGSGDCAISIGSGRDLNSFDMLGHEYTHLVSRTIINWRSSSEETTAISEGLSDVFGEFIEQACTNKECDWINDFRNIIDPSSNGYPAKVTDPNNSGEDFSHGYSTVISHAAYLMCNGIDGNDTKKINVNKLAELWYRAMLTMPSDCDFAQCRTLVELAASSMDLSVSQLQCVSEAFDKVGIPRASGNEYSQLVHYWEGDNTAIKGVVYEIKTVDDVETITPISEAIITVYDPVTGNNYRQISMNDADGFFEIDLEADRNYFVSFEAEGYITEAISFGLSEHEVQYFSISMEPLEKEAQEQENTLSGKCGDNLTWTLKNGVLTISGTGDMYDYDLTTFAFAPWYEYHDQITSLEIGPGVTSIGDYAFLMCYNLTDIIIPGNIKRIGDDAFHGCSQSFERKLNITIKPGVEVIGSGAFFQCFTLTNIELPDSITYIGDGAFFGCNMKSITIPSNVTYIGGQVFECDGSNVLEEIHFAGNAPQFAVDTFAEINATAYYPASNKSWTINVMKDYGGNITWIAEGKQQDGNELSAYIPYVQKAMKVSGYDVSEEYTHGFCSGILIDLDGDNVQELVLNYLEAPLQRDAWWLEQKLSVYDYENNKVVTKLNGVPFGEFGAAGESGYVSILYKSGKPYIMTYNESGETSGSGTIDPNRYGTMTIYDGITCKKISSYWIDRYNNVVSYKINGKTVDKNTFVSEVQQYYDAKVVLDYYALIEFPQMSVTASELLEMMK